MAYLSETQCCGIRELNEIQDTTSAEQAVLHAASDWFSDDLQRAFIFYSTVEGMRGVEITKYVRKNKLGTVTKMPTTLNGNTSRMLTLWAWAVNKANFRAFWAKNQHKYDNNQ